MEFTTALSMRRTIKIFAFRKHLNQFRSVTKLFMVPTLLGAEIGMMAIFSTMVLPVNTLLTYYFTTPKLFKTKADDFILRLSYATFTRRHS